MLTGLSGQLAGARLTYKDRVRIHTMKKDYGMRVNEIVNNTNMSYSTVWSAVSI